MAWIQVVPENGTNGATGAAYQRIRERRGLVANVIKISGLLPDVMERNLDYYMALMYGPHKLSRRDREMVAVEVSRANQCEYCVNHHGAALARVARDEGAATTFMKSGSAPFVGARERAMLDYARKLTLTPTKVGRADVDALRAAGFEDEEVLAINHVVGFFNLMNRVVLGLGVDLEPDKGAAPAYKY
jgi:uncharacterized peroxidase-related enzyme